MIGQFTIDVASAQAGLSHTQHPLKHLPLRSFFCTHISGYILVAAWLCDLLVRTTVLWDLRRSTDFLVRQPLSVNSHAA